MKLALQVCDFRIGNNPIFGKPLQPLAFLLSKFQLAGKCPAAHIVDFRIRLTNYISHLCLLLNFLEGLSFLLNLTLQHRQPFVLTFCLELCHRQMFLGTATFSPLHISVASIPHSIEEIILEDTVRLSQNGLTVLLKDRLTLPVHCRVGLPLLTAAHLGDRLLDGANQGLILASLGPQDLLFHHRYVDNMEMVVVHVPSQGL